jgi:hypothetical protein
MCGLDLPFLTSRRPVPALQRRFGGHGAARWSRPLYKPALFQSGALAECAEFRSFWDFSILRDRTALAAD